MAVRSIIKIDEDKCNGCGLCIPNCPEGAIRIIDGKARMISDIFCDGLGACLGHCPEGAITIIEREAEDYDEYKVMENVVKQGENTIRAHLDHMLDHNEMEYYKQAIQYLKDHDIPVPGGEEACVEEPLACGCPGSMTRNLARPGGIDAADTTVGDSGKDAVEARGETHLGNWPVQMMLINPNAPYLKDAKILVAADCTAYASGSLHPDFMRDRVTLIGCPKLDNRQAYVEKLAAIFTANEIRDILLLIMEVPCCGGMKSIVAEALARSGKSIPARGHVIGINGEVCSDFDL